MNFSELAYKHKTIFWFTMVAILFGGIYSFIKISKLEDPEIVVMQAMVVTVYPGGSAHDVELQVTNVLENELRSMDGIAEIRSTSSPNVSQISVLLKFTVPEKDIPQHWDVLRRKVEAARSKLPSQAMAPMVLDDIGDVYGMFYALTAPNYSYDEMNRYAQYVKRELLALPGVKRVELFGNQPSNIDIELSAEKMSQLGIFPAQIVSAVNNSIQPVYAGNYIHNNHTYRLGVDGRFTSIEEIRQLPIKGFENDQLRLGDIADIRRAAPDPERYALHYDNQNAIGISVAMESGENIIDVGKQVTKRLDEISQELPVGFAFNKVFYQPEKVRIAINDFMWNLVLSVVIVVLILMLTMGFKSGVIIGIGLIITILASFPVLYALDGTLQRISLGAFVVAMGMLVDNAIVVMDGIIIDLQYGYPIKHSLFNTAKKTAIPLLGATSIAVLAFVPVYFSPDTAGLYIGDLFIVLCISLLISWVLAMVQVPVFAASMLNFRSYRNKKTLPFDNKFYQWFRRFLHRVMDHKVITLSATAVILGVVFFFFKDVKRTFFPDFTYDQAFVEYLLPSDASPAQTIGDIENISSELRKMKGVKHVTTSHGMTPSRYCLVRSINQVGDNYGELIVDFDDYKTMLALRPKIENYIRSHYPDAYSRFRLYNISILSSHTVEAEFTGPDPAVLRKLTEQAEKIMRKSALIDPYTVCSDWYAPSKSLVAHYAQTAALQVGASRTDVSNTLLAATDGLPFGTFWEGSNSTPIVLKIRHADGSRIEDLNNLPVWNLIPNLNAINEENLSKMVFGTKSKAEVQKEIISPVPMSQVTNGIDLKWEDAVVHRKDGQRSMQAQCNPILSSNPSAARADIKEAIEAIKLPPGYKMEWIGEYKLQHEALKNVIGLLPIAAILIVLVLILLFGDIKKPIIILLCLPIAFIGIVPGLLIFDKPFSFVAIVGTIGMAGMMIKASIVLINEIELRIKGGSNKYEAIIEATISRARPVTMASMTTILGMIPLFGDPMYGPLGVTIMCGLLVGTLITLILVPIFYALYFNIKKPVIAL